MTESSTGSFGRARVLSYNFNILPRGCGGYQHERMDAFLESVDKFDILLLQEVYSSSLMPYALQKRFCYQKMLVDGLKKKGFHHYVLSRQPSYLTMSKYNIISDNGLVIASRFPIWHRGSYTFRSRERGEQPVGKGCLFAEIEIPCRDGSNNGSSEHVLFFNVHLRPEESALADSTQVQQLRQFIDSVLEQIQDKPVGGGAGPDACATTVPFVIAGDFNIIGIDKHSKQSSRKLVELLNALNNLGEPRDVLYTALGYHPPTRPAKLFFPTQYKLGHNEQSPQRQDYFLVNNLVSSCSASLERFVANSRRPYTYLSDHFGIDAVIEVPLRRQSPARVRSPSRINVSPLIGGTNHEHSNPTATFKLEALAVIFFVWLAVINLKFLVPFFLLFVVVKLNPSYIRVALPERVRLAPSLAPEVAARSSTFAEPSGEDGLPPLHSIGELWEASLTRHRNFPCVGCTNDAGEPQWWTYGSVDMRVRELGNGLLQMGFSKGDLIGVESEAHPNAVVFEITCALFGFVSVALSGKSPVVRSLLDQHKIRIVFSGRGALTSLLKCRSSSLEVVVSMQDQISEDDLMIAKEVNIDLLEFDTVQLRGRTSAAVPFDRPGGDDALLMSLDNVGTSDDVTSLVCVRHRDALRDVNLLLHSGVVPSNEGTESMMWYLPLSHVFTRLCGIALLARGNSIIASDTVHLPDSLTRFRPTLMVAQPSLFYNSFLQLRRVKERYSAWYNWLHDSAYQFLSKLIHIYNCDSPLVRFLFFRLYQRQLGGHVKRMILSVSHESTAFDLVEYISVCFSPLLLEVSYLSRVGIVAIDGVPPPDVVVDLAPLPGGTTSADPAAAAGIGQLTVQVLPQLDGASKRESTPAKNRSATEGSSAASSPPVLLDVAARWDREHSLSLLGTCDGVMWPSDYEYCTSAGLERVYSTSRYVSDVFAYCDHSKPIVAIVYPNRELLEVEYQLRHLSNRDAPPASAAATSTLGAGSLGSPASSSSLPVLTPVAPAGKALSWTSLVEFATDMVLRDIHQVCEENNLPPSHFPTFVHLHPHSFRDYANFFTPFGCLRRANMHKYFAQVIARCYGTSTSDALLTSRASFDGIESDGEASLSMSHEGERRVSLKVPFTIDIGGTFAKIAYVMPPTLPRNGQMLQHESSSLSERLGLRTFAFFSDDIRKAANEEVRLHPASPVGTLRFAKMPSYKIPQFVEFLRRASAKSLFAAQFMQRVRATGGGAFKYANLARNSLDVEVDAVKEMDAVVKGLNLIVRLAPESIFTVDFRTDAHHPHRLISQGDAATLSPFPYLLINIGSGISFIKCTDAAGSHVRVGGSPIGGATFWGLTRIMTSLTSWEEVTEIMRLDGPGDNKNVDLLVGDIYGYNAKDLPAMLAPESLASCFGKMGSDRFRKDEAPSSDRFTGEFGAEIRSPLADANKSTGSLDFPRSPQVSGAGVGTAGVGGNGSSSSGTMSIDIVRSLLNMIASNVTQLAYLHAKLHNVPNIFFAGGFVRDNPLIWTLISSYMFYWSNGETHAHFLEHDGYLGVLGCAVID